MQHTKRIFLAGLLLGMAGIAQAAEKQCVPVGKWLEVNNHSTISQPALLKRVTQSKVVLLGEDHDNPQHHRWQLQTIAKLQAIQPNMALGFEAFPRRVQPILDRWIKDELTEKEFLKAVDWETIWNYNPKYYMPMFQFARMNKIPLYALNVDRELIRKIGQIGWENIPENERLGVGDPAPPSQDYKDALAEIFSQHSKGGHGHGDTKNGEKSPEFDPSSDRFQRFIQSQQVWDRAMAEIAYQGVTKDSVKMFVAVLGAGHIMGGYGVPHQLKDLGINKVTGLLPWDGGIGCEQLEPGLADYVFGMTPPEKTGGKHEHPMLGVYLEPTANGHVNVSRIVSGSVAEKAGLKKDDVILEAAGKKVEKVPDVVNIVRSVAYGTWLPLKIQRDGKQIDIIAKFPAKK